ncbi:glycosyltransferase [Roseibium sp.]|uniref:glycosyltransferase n=1 Tax=Roseibium sp. TaxID=1936156 RepID=UPI003BAEDB1F
MSYQKFFKVLHTLTRVASTAQDRTFLQINAAKMINHYAALNATQKKQLVDTLTAFSRTEQLPTRVFLLSLLFNLTLEKSYLQSAILDYRKLDPGHVDYINDYYTLSNLSFLFPELRHEGIISSDLLRKIYLNAVTGIKQKFPPPDSFRPNPSRIVVMLDQLLGKKHAPSFRAIRFVQILQEDFQKEVLLLNTNMFSQLNSGYLTRRITPTVLKSLSQVKSEVVDGAVINLFQPAPPTLSDASIKAVLDTITAFGPSGILVVGNQCAIAEVFARDCFTLCSPLNNDVIPDCLEVNYHAHMSAPGGNRQSSESKGQPGDQRSLFQFEGPYDVPEKTTSVSRQELNLPDHRPVIIVVGYRLGFEIDDAFLQMLEDVVSKSDAFVYFLGRYADYTRLKTERPLLDQNSEYCTFQPDIVAVYEHCDLYLAPTRVGGGSSAVYAMASGLPVLSVSYGDIQITTQHFPKLETYEEVGAAALQILTSPDKMAEYRTFAQEGAKAIKDSKALMAEFLKHLDQFNETKAEMCL